MLKKNYKIIVVLLMFIIISAITNQREVVGMANKYCNLDGGKKIKNEYSKINIGFDKVDADLKGLISGKDLDPNKDIEVLDARGVSPTLGHRIDSIEARKADKIYVDTKISTIGNGSPKGTYTTLALLQSAFPTGTTGIYLVSADGNWYFWNDTAWVSGGVYQSTGIADGIVTAKKTDFAETINDTIYGDFVPFNVLSESNYLASTIGHYLDPETNTDATSQFTVNYIYTDYIPVLPNMKYVRMESYPILFFDAEQSFISGISGGTLTTDAVNDLDGYTFTIPSNCYFIRMNGSRYTYTTEWMYQTEVPIENRATIINNFKISNASKIKGKKIVSFGDSIFGSYDAPTDIPSYIANLTEAEVINVGFGGSRMGAHPSVEYDAFSMYRLGYSIAKGDFSLQDTYASDADVPTYFVDHLATLKTIDFNTVDIIIINFGTNDWGGNDPKDKEDLFDPTSYRGALRYALSEILTTYPHLKVLLLTPIYRFDYGDSDTFLNAGYLLAEYVTALKEMGKEFKTPVVDMYYESGISKYNRDYYFNSAIDKVHPNEKGRKRMAEKIVGELERNF